MVFIDYVTLLLINMTGGLFVLAHFLVKGLGAPDRRPWAPALAIPGVVGLVNGLHMTWTWPLPGAYNSAFGEMSVLLGILFLGAALSAGKNWSLAPVGTYAVFGGVASIILGVRFIDLGMTQTPLLSGIGFILTGLCGVLICPAFHWRANRTLRTSVAMVLVLAALIWAFTGYKAYWNHMERFSAWRPRTMQVPAPPEDQPVRSNDGGKGTP